MKLTEQVLTTRSNEIDSFLDLLSATDEPTSSVVTSSVVRGIAEMERNILRATVLLLLYNLTEAVCRTLITELRDVIAQDAVHFRRATKSVKETWIEMRWRNRRNMQDENATRIILELIELSQSKEPLHIDTTLLFGNLSGNVDMSVLKEIGEKFGFDHMPRATLREGIELGRVKLQRNRLGHGNVSFADCGRDFTPVDLLTLRNGVVQTLEDVLENVEKFVSARGYATR